MPPPPVFQALFLSFHVSLPGWPGAGTEYQRQSSLPVLTSSAASQPRVPASPAPFATITLPSAVIGAAWKGSFLPKSLGLAPCLSPTTPPLSRVIETPPPCGRVA